MAFKPVSNILRHVSLSRGRHVCPPLSSSFSAAASVAKPAGKKVGGPAQTGKGGGGAEGQGDRLAKLMNQALARPRISKLDISPEQQLRDTAFAKQYSSLKMKQHREFQKGESLRLKAKMAAITALPAGKLRDAAMQPDWAPFPSHRILPAESPPMRELLEDRERDSAAVAAVKKSR